MSQDPDQDDHLVFGAETESRVPAADRSRRREVEHAGRDVDDETDEADDATDDRTYDMTDERDADRPDEDDAAVFGGPDETTRARPRTPPPYAEPAAYETQPGPYDRRPPSFAEPPPWADDQTDDQTDDDFDDQPRFIDPPPVFGEPAARDEPPRFDEPASYERPAAEPAWDDTHHEGPRYEDPRYEDPRHDDVRPESPRYGEPRDARYDSGRDEPRYASSRPWGTDDDDHRQRPAYAERGDRNPGRADDDYAGAATGGYAEQDSDQDSGRYTDDYAAPQYSDTGDSPLFAETQNLAAMRRDEADSQRRADESRRPSDDRNIDDRYVDDRSTDDRYSDRSTDDRYDDRYADDRYVDDRRPGGERQDRRPAEQHYQDYPDYPDYPDASGYPDPTGRPDRRRAQHAAPTASPTPPPRDEPPPRPRPEDLLAPNKYAHDTTPASWGWRGRVSRSSGGLFKPKASQAELESRQAVTAIQRSFSRPMTVVVVQPKGGAGKTPTTICLSAAFGAHRGGYVVGWDDNETRGTLAVRVANPDNQRATVWDLLSDLDQFERFDARVGDLSYYVRAQPEAHFDALVSDDNPGNMAQIGEDEYRRLHQVLQRFYRMIVVDTGNNVRSPNWQSAVNSADLVVVVSTYQRDVGWSASWVLDHLAQTGREELARNAVTVLTSADPTFDKDVRDQLISHFSARTRAVAEIPYDPELAHGGPIAWTSLGEATRNAWVHAGAIVVNALVEKDNKTLDARRA